MQRSAVQPVPYSTMSTVTLSHTDFQHILSSIQPAAHSASHRTLSARHAISADRVSKWSNTLAAQKQQQQAVRLQEQYDRELRQLEVDQQEAAYQAEQRQQALNRCQQAKYHSTDRVAQFDAAMKLSDLNSDRRRQVAAQREVAAAQHRQDAQWQQLLQQRAEQQAEYERQLQAEKKRQQCELQAVQRQQLDEIAQRKLAQRQAVEADGAQIRQLTAQLVEQQAEAEKQRRTQQVLTNKSYLESNQHQSILARERASLAAVEAERIARYAAEIEARAAERKQQEQSMRQQKQETQNALIQRQVDLLRDLRSSEANRLKQQIEEFEYKQEYMERSKKERAASVCADIAYSRQQQLLNKQAEADRLSAIESALQAKWSAENAAALQAEQRTKQQAAEKRKQLQSELLQQIHANDERVQSAIAADRLSYLAHVEEECKEQEQFDAYVQSQLHQLAANNKSTTPALIALRHVRNSTRFTK